MRWIPFMELQYDIRLFKAKWKKNIAANGENTCNPIIRLNTLKVKMKVRFIRHRISV